MKQVAVMIEGWGEEVFDVVDENETQVCLVHPIDPTYWDRTFVGDTNWVDRKWIIPIPADYMYVDLREMVASALR